MAGTGWGWGGGGGILPGCARWQWYRGSLVRKALSLSLHFPVCNSVVAEAVCKQMQKANRHERRHMQPAKSLPYHHYGDIKQVMCLFEVYLTTEEVRCL